MAVLGPVEVRRDGQVVPVPSGKSAEVLVRLALEAGVLVRADRILDDLWATTGPPTAKNTLQSKVSQLRRALGDISSITGGHGGYRLAVDPDAVDALRLIDLSAASTELLRTGQPAAALTASNDALAMFHGDALPDAGESDWALTHRTRFEQVRAGLHEDNVAARVQLGGGNDVIGRLEDLIGQYPLRETLWFWLITALYLNGRQADALAAYSRVRASLIEELGVEPGPKLRGLERQVLAQDLRPVAAQVQSSASSAVIQQVETRSATTSTAAPTAAAARDRTVPATSGALAGAPPGPGNLPRVSGPLIGRVDEVDLVRRLINDRRLVTLIGPPGVGKTRLAIEVAQLSSTPGGAWLLRLDAVNAPAPLTPVLAELLNLPDEPAIIERLAAPGTLLIFDNCEHVVDAAADLVSRLLDTAPGLTVLATSQQPLGVEDEMCFPVDPLTEAAAVALFVRRATEIRPRFSVDDGSSSVESLCRSLDGLPLAIELAAARVKSLSVQEISRRLDHRFTLLQDPTSRRPERRRALAAAIGWSYDLLFPDDQRGLWALSCFAGGAPLAAAEHVLSALAVPPAAAMDVVGRLVDRSLVQVISAPSAPSATGCSTASGHLRLTTCSTAFFTTSPARRMPPGTPCRPTCVRPRSEARASRSAWTSSGRNAPISIRRWRGRPSTSR